MSKYYYRFPAESAEGRALRSFHRACQKADSEQTNYAKKVGAIAVCEDVTKFTGGVAAVIFKNPDKVNRNIWRQEGKYKDTGEPMFVPNVICDIRQQPLQEGQPIPKHSARRYYANEIKHDENGKPYVYYMEVTPLAQGDNVTNKERTRAVTAEMWRIKLPTVSVAQFYRAVHADLSSIEGQKRIEGSTPVFFCYRDFYYIGLDYPIHHEGIEESHLGEFQKKKNDMLYEARMKEKKQ